MKCQNCAAELPSFPRDAVEDGELEEVVAHVTDGDGIALSETSYYCGPECAAEAWGDA